MKNERGFSLIELLIVVAIIAVIAAIAIPNLTQSRISSNEASAISSIRTLATAQATFAATSGFSRYANDLPELEGFGVIDDALGSGTKNGYNFVVQNSSADTFEATGTPESARSGRRSFFVDQTGVIRWAIGAADSSSPPLGSAGGGGGGGP